jgi:hypothetical protein
MQPISIVIPIRDRAGRDVANALAALAWQRGGRPHEVVIVSHGSAPAIERELHALVTAAGASLISVGTPADAWNKPLALNTGIRATDPAVPFVMAMDGDMILAENFVETVIAALREPAAAADRIVLCQSRDLPEDLALPDEPDAIRRAFDTLAARTTLRARYGTGGIQAMRRSFLVDARGYDEDMRWWGALDTDLVHRAQAAGLEVAWITARTAMLHQWHPRKHRVLGAAGLAVSARGAWDRNHALMRERAGRIARNPHGWGAVIDDAEDAV